MTTCLRGHGIATASGPANGTVKTTKVLPGRTYSKGRKQMKPETSDATYQTWSAMQKFARDEPLTESEWDDISSLTLIDRRRLEFAPGNVRWAANDAERADNLVFYRSLGAVVSH
jgi:hypothetical protein